MTGRGAGYCAGYAAPGYANPVGGRGWFGRGRRFGRGRGWFGRGWRHWYGPGPGWVAHAYGDPYYSGYAYPTYPYGRELSTSDEMTMLREQSEFLQNELKEIHERIGTLEKAQTQEKK
jgi:hypothetical protein